MTRPISRFFFIAIIFIAACSPSKKISRADNKMLESVQSHVQFLADDKLEGRRTGTAGEKLAQEYIAAAFKNIGLLPKGDDGYIQAFDVYDGKQIDATTYFVFNGDTLTLEKDYFPYAFSGNLKIAATPSLALQEAEMPWFVDLNETLVENKNNPHFDLADYIYNNCKKAITKGATALLLYNSAASDDKQVFSAKDKSAPLDIPVVYITKQAAAKYMADPTATVSIAMNTSISDKKRIGHNVIGYINNNAATTVILGAHYDHLGYGEDGNSRYTGTDKAIHNGADDNASGSAALIELARILTATKATNNNYLFIAFSGEELGLFGSKYFTEHPTVSLSTVNYMINMDMVGRLSDSSKTVTIGGYGTSPTWSSVIAETPNSVLNIKIDSSGTGPSDHSSFYRKDIPVLFYFTGLHSDYHKPSDDADKINYAGITTILHHITGVIEALNSSSKLSFLKTREVQTTTSARFSVSMGIMPDYTFSGAGVKADGISDGKPAQKAGLQVGDIIIQLGEHTISSMETYMQSLGKFKKGDKTTVKFKRGAATMEATVEF